MKDSVQAGLETAQQLEVDETRVTRHMGDDLGVYGTPFLIRDIEHVCHDLLQEHVDAGEDSVGTRIDVQHLAPALEGARVTVSAKVTDVDRRAVTFEVSVSDEFEELARGTHGRFVVEKDRLKGRLQDKARKMRGE